MWRLAERSTNECTRFQAASITVRGEILPMAPMDRPQRRADQGRAPGIVCRGCRGDGQFVALAGYRSSGTWASGRGHGAGRTDRGGKRCRMRDLSSACNGIPSTRPLTIHSRARCFSAFARACRSAQTSLSLPPSARPERIQNRFPSAACNFALRACARSRPCFPFDPPHLLASEAERAANPL